MIIRGESNTTLYTIESYSVSSGKLKIGYTPLLYELTMLAVGQVNVGKIPWIGSVEPIVCFPVEIYFRLMCILTHLRTSKN